MLPFKAQVESNLRIRQNMCCDIQGAEWLLTEIITGKLPTNALEYVQRKVDNDCHTLTQIRTNMTSCKLVLTLITCASTGQPILLK